MITLIAAAAVAAAQPAAPAPAGPMANHSTDGQHAGHKDMDCCKDCCKDMAAKHEGHGADHAGHDGR
jgi:hypothetical protein